jgi:hypothetical protein
VLEKPRNTSALQSIGFVCGALHKSNPHLTQLEDTRSGATGDPGQQHLHQRRTNNSSQNHNPKSKNISTVLPEKRNQESQKLKIGRGYQFNKK